jgi:predicted transcriptional regulator
MKMQTGFRLADELIEKVDELAKSENRTRSNMVETLLYEALDELIEKGRLPKWKPRGTSA